MVLSGVVILSKECEDVDEGRRRSRGEVLDLVVSGGGVLSKEFEGVDEGRRRSRGRSLVSWCCLGL